MFTQLIDNTCFLKIMTENWEKTGVFFLSVRPIITVITVPFQPKFFCWLLLAGSTSQNQSPDWKINKK